MMENDELRPWSPPERFTELPIEDQRALLAHELLWGLPGLPAEAALRLAEALMALNSGQKDPLLEPSRRTRKGPRPFDRTQTELDVLAYRAFRIATGEREADVENDLAEAFGLKPGNNIFDQWGRKLSEELPEFKIRIDAAKVYGRFVVAGEPIRGPWADKEKFLATLALRLRASGPRRQGKR
jgi:hypothetical protein